MPPRTGKPRIFALYTEITLLPQKTNKSAVQAEKAVMSLRNAKEVIWTNRIHVSGVHACQST